MPTPTTVRTMRPCTRCGEPVFWMRSRCRSCELTDGREQWARNAVHYRRKHFRNRYGIEPEEVDRMRAEAGGLCQLCGKPPKEGAKGRAADLVVDHDHVTGKVRGMICFTCNIGLGQFHDDPDVLRAAAAWVEARR